MHKDLLLAQKCIYEPCSLIIATFEKEVESQEYGAASFSMNGKKIIFRVAKITPTKCGMFVTIWKREKNGPIKPFDLDDPVDLFVISVREGNKLDQFVFPKKLLCLKGYIDCPIKKGKRAMRVYPPWTITQNTQAKKTQIWQSDYFYEIKEDIDFIKIKMLFK